MCTEYSTAVLPTSQGGENLPSRNPRITRERDTDMTTSTHTSSPTPIYEELVEEHGDILAEAREAAERSQQTASQALDWSDLRRRH
ncbi:hypothetical protein HOK021_36340 [Streptomyces hygroscopicus]|nr:hypothetical protein HOK021_36340 [Streptomyces hygroscopicus]